MEHGFILDIKMQVNNNQNYFESHWPLALINAH